MARIATSADESSPSRPERSLGFLGTIGRPDFSRPLSPAVSLFAFDLCDAQTGRIPCDSFFRIVFDFFEARDPARERVPVVAYESAKRSLRVRGEDAGIVEGKLCVHLPAGLMARRAVCGENRPY